MKASFTTVPLQAHLALQCEVGRILSDAASPEGAAAPLLEAVCEGLGWEVGELWLVDGAGRASCAGRWGALPADAEAPLLAPEPELRRSGLRGMIRLPVSAHGEVRAILRLFRRDARPADETVTASLSAIGAQIGQFLERLCAAAAREKAEQELALCQDRLRALMADVVLAEEHERRRLAVDLHDGLSQTIALTRMKLAALRASLRGPTPSSLDEIEALIDQTNHAARSLTFELSPPVLHDLGLEPALEWLVENIQARYGIEIALEADDLPKPADEKTRVILFRSIRELLINAAKHAAARRVHVCLRRDEDRLDAAVEDDGIGMAPDARAALDAKAAKGFGLLSIRERLSHVGGSMRIESAPGRGTKVRLCAPLANGSAMGVAV